MNEQALVIKGGNPFLCSLFKGRDLPLHHRSGAFAQHCFGNGVWPLKKWSYSQRLSGSWLVFGSEASVPCC